MSASPEIARRGIMLVVSSPSGAGKTTLTRNLLEQEENVALSISVTTRERRASEIDGSHYHFISKRRFEGMREAGELGEILHVQGTYSQDWLLYDTDWNWRVTSTDGGPSRALADIGSHWCDMAEHVTGQRITSLCADL